MQILPRDAEVREWLNDGDECFFTVDSINFWLSVKFTVNNALSGTIDLKIDKAEKLLLLKKRLQILMVKVWYHSELREKDTFYMLD
jgi:hypothetical protein